MDPISLAASLITLISSTRTVIKTVEKLRGLHKAPDEVLAVINEVADLQAVLQDADDAQVILKHDSSIQKILLTAKAKLDELNALVDMAIRNVHSKKAIECGRARLAWPHYKAKILTLQQDLRSIRINIVTSLASATSSNVVRVELALGEISLVTSQTQAELNKRLSQNDESLTRLVQRSKEVPSRSQLQAMIQKICRDAVKQAQSTTAKDDGLSGLDQPPKPHPVGMIRVRTSHRVRCQVSCKCQCHRKRFSIQSPSSVSKLLGFLFVGYYGFPVQGMKCDSSSCQQVDSPTAIITYYFPQWLLARRFLLWLSYDSRDGPQFGLKFPRVIADTADLFTYSIIGDLDGVRSLLERGLASTSDIAFGFGTSALHYAFSNDHPALARFLIHAGADPLLENKSQVSAVDIAWTRILSEFVGEDAREAFIDLLGSGSLDDQIERRQFSDLHLTVLGVKRGDVKLEIKSNPQSLNLMDRISSRTALYWAAARGDKHVMLQLCLHRAEITLPRSGTDALHCAIAARTPTCILPLLRYSANPDSRSAYGETGLHIAATRHDDPENYMTPLLDYGATVDAYDFTGRTPLMYAVQAGHPKSVRYLLQSNAYKDAADMNGLTAVGHAVIANSHDILKILLDWGVDYRQILTKESQNLLHLTTKHADSQTVFILQQANITLDPDARDISGLDAHDLILQRSRERNFASTNTLQSLIQFLSDVRERWSSLYLRDQIEDEINPTVEVALGQVTETPGTDEDGEEPTIFEDAKEDFSSPQ